MRRQATKTDLILLITTTMALTAGLQMMDTGLPTGGSDPVGWLNSATPEQALAASLRLGGIVAGYWVLGTTAVYVIATRSGNEAPAWIRLATLPGVRRLVDRALATAVAASVAVAPFTPATAEDPPPPIVFDVTTDGVPVPHIRLKDRSPTEASRSTPSAAGDSEAGEVSPTLVVTPMVARGANSVVPAPSGTSARVTANYTVEVGDNLWLIADRHLRNGSEEPSANEVAEYWQQVIAANRTTLRSGDPNLIFPGEVVLLPEQEITQ